MASVDFNSISTTVLKTSTRNQLALLMDQIKIVPSLEGLSRDYQGLAELMGFDHSLVKALESIRHESATRKLLEKWEFQSDATIGKLLDFLNTLERFDVIDDLMPKFEADAQKHLEKQERLGEQSHSPIQVPEITSSPPVDPEKFVLTRHDAEIIGQEKVRKYDAFVCYTEEDEEFVEILVENLEKKHQLKLFIEERDLLPGVTEFSAIMELIQTRCQRMLVVVSPAFLASKKREFQMVFAQALSFEEQKRRVIPVIYKQCDLPTNLKVLSRLNYTKEDTFGCFWPRLLNSIQPQHPMSSSVCSSMNELSVQTLMSPGPVSSFRRSSSTEKNERFTEYLNSMSQFNTGVFPKNEDSLSFSNSYRSLSIPNSDSGISRNLPVTPTSSEISKSLPAITTDSEISVESGAFVDSSELSKKEPKSEKGISRAFFRVINRNKPSKKFSLFK